MTAPDKLSAPGVQTRAVLATAAGILVFLAATLGGLGWTYYAAVPRQPVVPPRTFPAPQLETGPGRQLQQLLVQQRRALSGIDAAIAQIVQRGARAYDPITAAAANPGTSP
jgi:hypothetical protein